jgi:hypothetical protein
VALYPIAGQRIYIGGVKPDQNTDFVAADFTSQTWVEIDGWVNAGAVGDNTALITTALINRGRDVKQKGTANAGQMQNQFAVIADDPGQIALLAAAAGSNKNNYAFRVLGNDAPASGPDPEPSERLFVGLVMSAQEPGGDANTIRMLDATIEINSNIVKIAATDGS